MNKKTSMLWLSAGFILFSLTASVAYAAEGAADGSIKFLSYIFGSVGGILPSTTVGTGEVIGRMFGVFNQGILMVGSLVIMYTLVVATLNTAHEGELLGKQWSSIWIPVRSALGMGTLLPISKVGGYSIIQIFVMWIVVQGVGLADKVWDTALDYIKGGGSIFSKELSASTPETAIQIFRAWVCVKEAQKQFSPSEVQMSVDEAGTLSENKIIQSWSFPSQTNYKEIFPGQCGSFSAATGGINTSQRLVEYNTVLIHKVGQIAAAAVNDPAFRAEDLRTWQNYISNILSVANNYSTQVQALYNEEQEKNKGRRNNLIDAAKKYGWIIAGAYYHNLAHINDATNSMDWQNPFVKVQPGNFDSIITVIKDKFENNWQVLKKNWETTEAFIKFYKEGIPENEKTPAYIDPDFNFKSNFDLDSADGIARQGLQFLNRQINLLAIDYMLKPWINALTGMDSGSQSLTSFFGDIVNPLLRVQAFGTFLLNGIIFATFGTAAVVCGVSLGISWIPLLGPAMLSAMTAIISLAVPFLSWFTLVLFLVGSLLAYYVPLIPLLLFTMAVIGWFLAVIEAMVAAPLVALGIVHPEGQHQLLGKAEPAMLLLANVFLRPVLIIFGFMIGTGFVYLGVRLINIGFLSTLTAMVSGTGESFFRSKSEFLDDIQKLASAPNIMVICAGIVMYTYAIIGVINKCFSPIYLLPAQVMTWIGGSPKEYGEEHMASDLKGQITGSVERGGQSITGGGQQLVSGATKAGAPAAAVQKKIGEAAKGKVADRINKFIE